MVKNKVIGNIAYLVSSSLITKIVLFLFYIYVARILGPNGYGYISSSTEYVGLFLIFATFGLQMAIVREASRNLDNQIELFNKILPARFVFSIISFVFCITICYFLYWDTVNFPLIMILAIMVLLQPLEDHCYSFFWVKQELKFVAFGELVKIVVYIGSFILLNVLFGLQLTNLVISTLLGFLCSILFKMKWLKRRYRYQYQFIIDIPYIRKVFYISFYFGIVSIIYVYSLKIDIQMLNVICGSTEVGYYSVAWQMVQIGIVFIQSLSTSLFPNSVQKIHLRSFRMKLLKYITYLTLFVILCALLVTFLSDSIIKLLYGTAYSNSALLLNLLVWYLPMRLFAVWGSQILESGAWYKKRVLIYLTPLAINIVLNYIYLPLYGAQAAAVIALISNFILVSLITIFAFIYSKKYYSNEDCKMVEV